jgi:hypothetical protein
VSPSAYIAAISGTVIVVMGAMLYIKDKQATAATELAARQEMRAMITQKAWDTDREMWKLQQEHAYELERNKQSSQRNIEQINIELGQARAATFTVALEAPVDAGDNFTSFLAWWMCEKERSGSDGQGTCDIDAAANPAAVVNFLQIFTPTVAEQWAELCEAGQPDFCNYVTVGFTWDGWYNFQNYLMRDLLATQGRAQNLQYYERVIGEMQAKEAEE